MRVAPFPVKYARAWIENEHRRIKQLTGAMWCVGLWEGAEMRGLAVVGRPNARMNDVRAGEAILNLTVLRVAVREETRNGCSMLYGACSQAAKAMGADSLSTYIHLDEHGTSLKAAGWVELRQTEGGEWSRQSRVRRAAFDPNAKIKYVTAWSREAKENVSCR